MKTVLIAACLLLSAGPPLPATKAINGVSILADDLGWSDTTRHGATRSHRDPDIEGLTTTLIARSGPWSESVVEDKFARMMEFRQATCYSALLCRTIP
jgi:hypothetical protein